MATIKFRFATECEMTLRGESYEDIYLQFKDFMHGDQRVARRASVTVFPPESVQVFFNLENSERAHEIAQFKGDFRQDIVGHCTATELQQIPRESVQHASWGSNAYPDWGCSTDKI